MKTSVTFFLSYLLMRFYLLRSCLFKWKIALLSRTSSCGRRHDVSFSCQKDYLTLAVELNICLTYFFCAYNLHNWYLGLEIKKLFICLFVLLLERTCG